MQILMLFCNEQIKIFYCLKILGYGLVILTYSSILKVCFGPKENCMDCKLSFYHMKTSSLLCSQPRHYGYGYVPEPYPQSLAAYPAARSYNPSSPSYSPAASPPYSPASPPYSPSSPPYSPASQPYSAASPPYSPAAPAYGPTPLPYHPQPSPTPLPYRPHPSPTPYGGK